MQKGEIYLANLNPTKGSEKAGQRPVVIVSGNLLNQYAPVVWVCPLSSSIKYYHGDLILRPNKTNGLKQKSEVLIMHLRSISKGRLEKKLGQLSKSDLEELRRGIKEVLVMD
ncbi:MAG: type II toxin-antitoxin system PemK/MazF family toxin [Vicingaceae bacterium]